MKSLVKMIALLLALCATVSLTAQTITPQSPFNKLTPFEGADHPRAAGGTIWADYDNDGKLDVLIFGYGTLKLYKNNGDKTFTDVTATVMSATSSFTMLYKGAAAWLDYNKDGNTDLLIFGNVDGSSIDTTVMFKNQGEAGSYALIPDETIQLPVMVNSDEDAPGRCIAVADYDGDSYPDILMSGKGGGAIRLSLYKNNGGTAFELKDNLVGGENFMQVCRGSVAWGDFNNDGRPDILFAGEDGSQYRAGIYKQNEDKTFTLVELKKANGEVIGTTTGEAAWIDYDKDGYLDVLLTGQSVYESAWTYWNNILMRNKQDGTFEQVENHGIGGSCQSSVAVGDYNGDGYDDVVMIGQSTNALFQNNAGENFTQKNSLGIEGEITKGMATLVDFDGDDDLDVVLVGNYIVPTILEKTASIHPAFAKSTPFKGAGYPRAAGGTVWADYDKDGKQDVLIFGYGTLKLYKGVDDTTYTDVTATAMSTTADSFAMLYMGSAAWLDYNKDGDMDLLISGHTGKVDTTLLYKNQGEAGSYALVPDATIQLPTMSCGSEDGTGRYIAVADYDGDSYPDILMSGKTKAGRQFSLYKNNGGTAFELQNTLVGGANFMQVSEGSVAWGDYNSDGRLDILFAGFDGSEYHSGIYKQNEDKTFTLIDLKTADGRAIGLQAGEVAWIDYDGDSKLDVLLTGIYKDEEDAMQWWNTHLLHNNGDDTFTEVTEHGIAATCQSSIAVGDINKDGYADVVLTGQNMKTSVGVPNLYYNNAGAGTFTKRTTLGFADDITKGMATLVDVNKDDNLDIVVVGNYIEPALFINLHPEEAAAEPTPPAPLQDTVIRFTQVDVTLSQKLQKGAGIATGDYNNDGHLDVLMWGLEDATKQPITKLYKNNGNDTLTDVTSTILPPGFPQLCRASAAWFDYNNDGRLDLVVTGATGMNTSKNDSITSMVSGVYFNQGQLSQWKLAKAEDIVLPATQGEKNGGTSRNIAIADYNNDGFTDILMMGSSIGADGKSVRIFHLYKNVGGKNFELQDKVLGSGNFTPTSGGMATWGDYNNDGYADILFAGYSTKYWSGIYKNNGNGTFTEETPFGDVGTESGEVAWIDYDNDGNLDAMITGLYYTDTWNWWNTFLYRNNGDGSFTKVENSGIGQTSNSAIATADLDNNGYTDVLFVGQHEAGAVFYNNGDGTFKADRSFLPKNDQGSVALLDINGDKKLDVITTGLDNTSLWKNEDGPVPTAPATPTGLSATENENSLTLSWDASTDKTVSYNLYMKRQGARFEITSLPLSIDTASGFLKVGLENATLNFGNSITISGLPNGSYSWGVEAVGSNRAISSLARSTATVSTATAVKKADLGSFKVFKRGSSLVVATDIAAENAELSVYSISGLKVWSNQGYFFGETEINGLQRGAYLVVIRVGNNMMVEKAAY